MRLEPVLHSFHMTRRPRWIAVVILVVGLGSFWVSGVGRREVLNSGGWPLIRSFFVAAAKPEVSPTFLRDMAGETLTTVGFAVLGTLLAVILGFVFGLASSARLWRASPAKLSIRAVGLFVTRVAMAFPRGVHEIVWGLFFVGILGTNPLVAILALGIPFGATTAKVYSELIDDASTKVFSTLTSSGAPSTSAFFYGVMPMVSRDMVSYAFYRLECAIRSAAVVGFIGAGGLGFRLAQANSGNNFAEVWTILYIIAVLCLIGEQWSAVVRRVDRRIVRVLSVGIACVLIGWSWIHLDVRVSSLWAERATEQYGRLGADLWPPMLPQGGWSEVLQAVGDTLQMSMLAMVIATALGAALALMAARSSQMSPLARSLKFAVRFVILVVRAVPITLWALLVVFVVLPGILPGAVALAIYTGAVLARLFGEVLENSDRSASTHIAGLGAPSVVSHVYGSMPAVAPGWGSAALYRWEVTTRETVVVGMVGAGGLGRLAQAQLSSFNYQPLLTTLVALILVTVFVDQLSALLRRRLR
jgi:phosphonate transport system permease protein